MTLSTLEAMFKGQADLFRRLKAEQWVQGQAKHPLLVLKFDMSGLNTTSSRTLEKAIKEAICRTAREHNVILYSQRLNGMFTDLLVEVYKAHEQVIVLIDEYDKPILDNLTDLAELMRCVKFCARSI